MMSTSHDQALNRSRFLRGGDRDGVVFVPRCRRREPKVVWGKRVLRASVNFRIFFDLNSARLIVTQRYLDVSESPRACLHNKEGTALGFNQVMCRNKVEVYGLCDQ